MFGDLGTVLFELAELGGVVDAAEYGLDGAVREIGNVGDGGDLADGGALGHADEGGAGHVGGGRPC